MLTVGREVKGSAFKVVLVNRIELSRTVSSSNACSMPWLVFLNIVENVAGVSEGYIVSKTAMVPMCEAYCCRSGWLATVNKLSHHGSLVGEKMHPQTRSSAAKT